MAVTSRERSNIGSIRIGHFDNFNDADTLLIEVDDAGLESFIALCQFVEHAGRSRLEDCAGAVAYGGISVFAECSSEDIGLIASNDDAFIWRRSPAGWADVVEKLRAMRNTAACHQYLDAPTDRLQVMVAKGEFGDAWWRSHAGAANSSLAEIGLDFDGRETELRVVYNPPAEMLIAILVPRRPVTLGKRIFLRKLRDQRYCELSLPNELASVVDVAVCSELPVMFLNVFTYRNAARAGADFDGVVRIYLPGGAIEQLPLPVLVDTSQWEGPAIPTELRIDEIVAVSTAGQRLYVVAAIAIPTGETLHSVRFERWLSTFDVDDGSLKPLAELPAMFA